MLVNVITVKSDLNGHNYIYIENPDFCDEYSWYKYWEKMIYSLKEIIPDYELVVDYFNYRDEGHLYLFTEDEISEYFSKVNIEETSDSIFINTLNGKLKISCPWLFHCQKINGDDELLEKVISLLVESGNFVNSCS